MNFSFYFTEMFCHTLIGWNFFILLVLYESASKENPRNDVVYEKDVYMRCCIDNALSNVCGSS